MVRAKNDRSKGRRIATRAGEAVAKTAKDQAPAIGGVHAPADHVRVSPRYSEVVTADNRQDWILIRDELTKHVILVNADDRQGCLYVLNALNIAARVNDPT